MTAFRPKTALATHAVENQPAERGDLDLWAGDLPLRQAVARAGGRAEVLAGFGAAAGSEEMRAAGRLANRFPPELRAFDRAGRRIDEVVFHPAYHELMRLGIEAGYSAVAWAGGSGGHATHAAMVYLLTQVEPGVCCPMTMTFAAVPALRAEPAVAAAWEPRILSADYDRASVPADEKRGVTVGMAMTEKQGGSDVRANITRAERDGEGWRLFGHKWFCSAPMSDAFLTLAQASGGLTCFLVPRWTPDGERNAVELVRLKDKLGNRANASAEIEYRGAWGRMLGGEGDGVRTIIEMVHHTRLDTAMAPAGLMRAALSEALWWCSERRAFGRRLLEQPLMASVLADLALEVEAAVALGMRVARAFDEGDRAFARVGVALAKFLNNKRCPQAVYEAMECLGGAGYVEEGPMPLLYREAPLNSIWEGSGNVICLDVLRSLARDAEARRRLEEELDAGRGRDAAYDAGLDRLQADFPALPGEGEARLYVERLATLLAAACLLDGAPEPVAEAYVAARIAGEGGRVAGALTARVDRAALIGEGDAVLKLVPVVMLGLAVAGCSRMHMPAVAMPGSGAKGTREVVENRAWIDTDPAAAKGTLRAFLSDGTLVMTSCTEPYRLAPWRWVDGTTLVWEEDGKNVRADVVMAERKEMALVIDPDGLNQSHHYAAAQSPVVCPDLR